MGYDNIGLRFDKAENADASNVYLACMGFRETALSLMEKTCRDYITYVMRCGTGRRWTNVEITDTIRKSFGVTFQNNTIAKNLSFMINDGEVQSEPAPGKDVFQYWLIQETKKKKIERPESVQVDIDQLMEICLKTADGYPEDHPQRIAIMNQYESLKMRMRRAA